MLKLYNSLGKKIQDFKPQKDGEVSLYVCGLTPDAATHLGHAFTYLTFDVLIRYFRFKDYKVNYLQNVTDIDDDILVRSKKAGRDWQEFGTHFTKVFEDNMNKLGWIHPEPYVRATDAIPTIVKIVKGLVENEFAYEVDGIVYFDVSKYGEYGKLGKFGKGKMTSLLAERGGDPDDPNKRNPLDFILWQKGEEGEPTWESPWSAGRPGWHIECSSMIYENLGEQIDIHGGGADLIFPHHESEIAQSESFTGRSPFAKYWMHVAYLRYKGEKMSKSLGNLILTSDLLEKYSANAIRHLLLSHHYREEWEYTDEQMQEAVGKWELLEKRCYSELVSESRSETPDPVSFAQGKQVRGDVGLEVLKFLEDDLDTPGALKCLDKINSETLKSSLELLGFQV
ncbi:MAG TPA: cysteine--tRNA ligase [Patescibacteria group bacterium]|nr:cysteine--tRNA ligase [Patescibacteria group bacterium]